MTFYDKYIKYKTKYISLKGGNPPNGFIHIGHEEEKNEEHITEDKHKYINAFIRVFISKGRNHNHNYLDTKFIYIHRNLNTVLKEGGKCTIDGKTYHYTGQLFKISDGKYISMYLYDAHEYALDKGKTYFIFGVSTHLKTKPSKSQYYNIRKYVYEYNKDSGVCNIVDYYNVTSELYFLFMGNEVNLVSGTYPTLPDNLKEGGVFNATYTQVPDFDYNQLKIKKKDNESLVLYHREKIKEHSLGEVSSISINNRKPLQYGVSGHIVNLPMQISPKRDANTKETSNFLETHKKKISDIKMDDEMGQDFQLLKDCITYLVNISKDKDWKLK